MGGWVVGWMGEWVDGWMLCGFITFKKLFTPHTITGRYFDYTLGVYTVYISL